MRFVRPSAFLIAAAMLSGCMGSTGSTPSAVGAMSAHQQIQTKSQEKGGGAQPVLKFTNAVPDTSCPSEYTGGCYAVDAGNPVSFEWCVSSTGNCSSGLVGDFEWTATVTVVKTGKVLKPGKGAVIATWSPDPGNPSTVTIAAKAKKIGKKPKVTYSVSLSACSSSIGCFSNFVTYGIEV